MKHGFTMIELIFVIVILGILAAIAVPKLTSVKDDAEASKAVSNLGTFINELTVYYTTHESTFPDLKDVKANAKPKDFTNVGEVTMAKDGAAGTAATFNFKAGSNANCITITPKKDAIILDPKLDGSNGCKIAIVAAVKAGLLHGKIEDGKVTEVGDGSIQDPDKQALGKKTLISVSGGKSGMYDADGMTVTQ